MRMIRTITITSFIVSLLAGSAVGAAAQDEDAAPISTAFTGAFTTQSDPIREGDSEAVDGVDYTTGVAVETSMVSSDPRLTGEVVYTANWLLDLSSAQGAEWDGRFPGANMLSAATFELTNDGGSWLGEGRGFHNVELDIATEAIVFSGFDGYDGMTAFLVLDSKPYPAEYQGMIFDATMPEVPEPYAVE